MFGLLSTYMLKVGAFGSFFVMAHKL